MRFSEKFPICRKHSNFRKNEIFGKIQKKKSDLWDKKFKFLEKIQIFGKI